jgi:hypothetical protein
VDDLLDSWLEFAKILKQSDTLHYLKQNRKSLANSLMF